MSYDYDSLPIGYYDAIYAKAHGAQSKWHHMKFERFRLAIAGLWRHLDIGCGPGTFIGSLAAGAHRSTGVDVARAQIDYAQAKYGGTDRDFRVVAPGPLPFDDGVFDAVTCIELIEHLPDAESLALLRETLRVLRPGGTLFLSTPNYASAWPWVEKAVNRLGPVDYTDQHISRHDRSTLSALLRGAGCATFDIDAYMLAAPFAATLSWRLADALARVEPAWLVRRCGLLLFASVRKP